MTKNTEFSGWGFDEKLTRLPDGIRYYKGTLDLSRTSGVDMIPTGLMGVRCVKMGLEEINFPNFVAPDYMGDIQCEIPVGAWFSMSDEAIEKAKKNYIKYRKFAESARRPMGGLRPCCVLPVNMCFYEKDGKTFLDLTRTTITEKPEIYGVEVIMPPKKLQYHHHRGCQMVHSKPRIKE